MALRLLLLLVLVCAPAAADAGRDASASPRPVLIELFTSQGCSMCPAANELLGELAQDGAILALSYGVPYWDVYGWRDTYARPEFAARQRAYKHALGVRRVYTPQFVASGARQAPGSRPEGVAAIVDAALSEAASETLTIDVRRSRGGGYQVGISGRPPEGGADVWLVIYEPGWREVDVTDGANAGRRVRHYNPVIAISRLYDWRGGDIRFAATPPAATAGAVIVQQPDGGPVLAVARVGAGPAQGGFGID